MVWPNSCTVFLLQIEAYLLGILYIADAEEAARKAEAAQKRAADIASGAVQMNGRELFQHEPWVFDNNIY